MHVRSLRATPEEAELACYPDVTVVRGDDQVDDDAEALVNPKVVIEVLPGRIEAAPRRPWRPWMSWSGEGVAAVA